MKVYLETGGLPEFTTERAEALQLKISEARNAMTVETPSAAPATIDRFGFLIPKGNYPPFFAFFPDAEAVRMALFVEKVEGKNSRDIVHWDPDCSRLFNVDPKNVTVKPLDTENPRQPIDNNNRRWACCTSCRSESPSIAAGTPHNSRWMEYQKAFNGHKSKGIAPDPRLRANMMDDPNEE